MTAGSSPADTPGILIYNANIHTMDPKRPKAEVLAAKGGELIYVGDDALAAENLLPGRGVEKYDIEGKTVIPGLIEGHAHLRGEGLRLGHLDLHHLSKEEALAAIKRRDEALPPGQWLEGYGWNQEKWPGAQWPNRDDLDAVIPDRPAIFDRTDKHSIWVNSAALKAAGLTDAAENPEGGEYLRDSGGRLSGILVGNAMWPVKKAVPPLDEKGLLDVLLKAQAEYFSFGMSSVMNAGADLAELDILKTTYQSGLFKLRTRNMLWAYNKSDEAYFRAGGGPVRGLFDERFSIEGVKIHSDGSLGSRSAWLGRDYADRPGHRGGHTYTDDELLAVMLRAKEHGMMVTIHTIGDAAVHQALAAMKKALGPKPREQRWRIEHFQVVAEEDLALALELGVIPSIQSIGLITDMGMAEERLGPELMARAYRWREILDNGGIIVNGSDGPVESINPFEGIYAAVARRDLQGRPEGGWQPADKLTRAEALASYTTWAAFSEFNENRKGRLAPGYLADLAVIDRDIMACPEDEIKEVRALMTFVHGELCFS